MKHHNFFLISSTLLLLLLLLTRCKKDYLDQKPDLSKAVPSTLGDCQAMLDDYDRMNAQFPDHGEAAADNYYMTDVNYDRLPPVNGTPEQRYNYSWQPEGEHVSQYSSGYQIVYSANMVLSVLGKLSSSDPSFNTVKGSALFFRAFAIYHLAQLFCKPYTAVTAKTDLGIPLRLTADPNEVSARGTVQQVYDRITADLIEAVSLLPLEVVKKSRPSKAAAYAALARVYLSMEDYTNAGKMANECLKLQNTLIDYNATSSPATFTTVNSNLTGPSFVRFNTEVIFQAVTQGGILSQAIALIRPDLYNSYNLKDRRRTVFFQNAGANVVFRGNYDGISSAVLFMGLATNEMYLIRAECYARIGNIALAMQDLNTLMAKRMVRPYVNRTATSAHNALVQILTERRKELIFRTLRWTDLRRLNKDPQFAITLRRDMNNITYEPLKPNDLRYTFLIPTKEVILLTGMEQNPR
ncbi:RagB/SusD family nutrient uptake outer membrane protein [Sphingobacterium sp. UDSM-2020]|uniref:RagB/SusD family nutrient uptake outer membrane protein n=1 Tax=Sphingobacterium sp. UDSM-2020 TaxID=2795738 RepID=UPI0019386C58|nr:RagB/SusD family nutrient uptake outer membrane protein [Sphingobacterium sp. UDSM-2020]QQD16039.1 RagB/SusD family nutrient uptake outer membrane protein [Sphingobacterium sp. UDSM-2020]